MSLLYVEMVKKVDPRLHDPASWLPLAAGAGSRNLGPDKTFIKAFELLQRVVCTLREAAADEEKKNRGGSSSSGRSICYN